MPILAWLALAAAGLLRAQDFPNQADAVFAERPFANAVVGAQFVAVADGTAAYSRNPDLALVPASTAKLASSAAALMRLKPEFRFTTTLLAEKKDQGKRSLATLIWRGQGDPSISGRGRASLDEIFEIWADSLTAAGVRRVKRLVLDGRYFEGPVTVPAWPDQELSYWYQAQTSAISFNDNCVDLEVRPASRSGRLPAIKLTPDFGYIRVLNQAVTGRGLPHLDYRREPGTNTVRFFGYIPPGPPYRDFVSVHDPARFAAEALRRVWKRKGLRVGKIVSWEDAGLREESLAPILTWRSQPLAEIIKIINKNSQNFYAEQLLRTLGKEAAGRGSFEAGLGVVAAFLREAGLAESSFHLVDGCGLSEQDRFTADGLVRVLRHMRATPYFTVYYESLAAPGVDRAAKGRMKADPLAAGMRLKRGTVGNARNLAGYLKSKSGKLYAFAILVNGANLDRPAVDEALDRVCLAAAHRLP